MGVYHITYTPELHEICLYFDGGCQFSCHGCITDYNPWDCHIKKLSHTKNRTLSIQEVTDHLKYLSFDKVIFLGKEPTIDRDFLPLTKILKERFSTYNIFLTNGWEYIDDKTLNEVCVSIKVVSKRIFKDFTGLNNPIKVLTNFRRYVATPNLKVRAESIFIPDYIDTGEIEKIARFIASVDNAILYRIDGYIPKKSDRFRKPTKGEMKEAQKIAKKYLKNVSILHSRIKLKAKVKRVY